jgi:hypothetical protein
LLKQRVSRESQIVIGREIDPGRRLQASSKTLLLEFSDLTPYAFFELAGLPRHDGNTPKG